MKLLMNSGDLTATQGGQPGTDPVEMRRLNYQTPAMVGHPPIPVGQLVAHVDALKANDNLRFSQEYEVGTLVCSFAFFPDALFPGVVPDSVCCLCLGDLSEIEMLRCYDKNIELENVTWKRSKIGYEVNEATWRVVLVPRACDRL